ncbi:MAG: hypothetical protein NC204_01545 [Candidatus Amulumruptor caecigallinarius]|nr:hypothetical protein [Candidatus Amulumruptor caecigallinarius]
MRKTLFGCTALLAIAIASCNSSSGKTETAEADAEFAAAQPMESGQYSVTGYKITGKNAMEGKFDGRMLISLSPEASSLYVYENGNRTGIDYKVVLSKSFEKKDSVYVGADSKGRPVRITPDSSGYRLTFEKAADTCSFQVEKAPLSTGTPFEILERINKQMQKK